MDLHKASLHILPTKLATAVFIRWLIRRDLPEVLEIEQAGFMNPWAEDDFLRCLDRLDCISLVAEQGERVVGFVVYKLHKARLHVLNFAVHPAWRRQGVGAGLVANLRGKLGSRRRALTLDVSERNLAAQLFFRSQGFRAASVQHGYYEGDDAYRMIYCQE